MIHRADDTVSAKTAIAVVPNDSANLALGDTRGLYVGGTGAVTVLPADPNAAAVTFTNVQGGTILPIQVRRVLATGTSATSIVALY